MHYMGSKNKIAKELIPIIQDYIDKSGVGIYIEPFVGGANVIDKIRCERRIGYDVEPYIISLLTALRDGWVPPETISEAEYRDVKARKENYPPELVGYCGYQLSYGGKFFDCYRRDKIGKRDYCREAYNLTAKQVPNLQGIEFAVKDYRELTDISGAVIYCDPPYRGASKYTAVGGFDYDYFYNWCIKMAAKNTVLVSERWMPEGFKEIWHKPVKICLDSGRSAGLEKTEKLFEVV